MKMRAEDATLTLTNTKPSFGIVQGRLSTAPEGQVQWFPNKNWETEFYKAASVGLSYIEFFAEKVHNTNNPLWSTSSMTQIRGLCEFHGLKAYAFCNDYILANSLLSLPGLDQSLSLLESGAYLGCKQYVLPLFEASDITLKNADKYAVNLRNIADKAQTYGITICLETSLKGEVLVEVLNAINHSAVKVVFDTGNRVAFGHDLPGDIRLLGDKIAHVHVKDKNIKNENVFFGTGLVNFFEVFKALADINYAGAYTFESQRGKDPVRTAKYNLAVAKYFYEETLNDRKDA